MSRPLVKICGLTTPEAVESCLTHRADFIGFVVYPKSPRHVEPDHYALLAKKAQPIPTVLVTVNASDGLLESYLTAHRPTYIQCHGSETPERCAEIRARGVKIIKALPIATASDFSALDSFRETADILLLDAKPVSGELPGGNAKSFDWSLLADRKLPKNWMLSGGLNITNITEALKQTDAPMIDLSSGVESTPGIKSPELIAELFQELRN